MSAQDMIVEQPQDITICEADKYATFSISVAGDQNSDYLPRWYRSTNSGITWDLIQGANGFSHTDEIAGKYKCVVIRRSDGRTQESDVATLTVLKIPSIKGIEAQEVCYGSALTASVIDSVSAHGSRLTSYEWKLELDNITHPYLNPVNNIVSNQVFENMTRSQNVRLTVSNFCGSASVTKHVQVWNTPSQPTPIARNYCEGAEASVLSISEASPKNIPVWYDVSTGGEPLSQPPRPNTSRPDTYKWWVLQRVVYGDNGPICESARREVTVAVFPKPAPPSLRDTSLCLGDPSFFLQAKGAYDIGWFDSRKSPLSQPPQINSGNLETLTYYAIQYYDVLSLRCESPIDDGKITIQIKGRANADNIELSYIRELCPNNSAVVEAYVNPLLTNPVFKWYPNRDKTGTIPPSSVITTTSHKSTLTTPDLAPRDSAYTYYVTIEYGGLCESNNARSVVINVRDIEAPYIEAPPSIVVSTNAGECIATNINLGRPLRLMDNCTSEEKLKITIHIDTFTYNPLTDIMDTIQFKTGDHQITWWVEDEAKNKYYATQNISVRDMEKPRGTCPTDVIKEIDETESSAIVHYELNYTDNCFAENLLEDPLYALKDSLYRGLPSGSVFPLGETRIVRYIYDKAGNVDTCSFKVIVRHPYREMELILRPSKYLICQGEEVVITPVISGGSGNVTYFWNPRSWTEPVIKDYPWEDTPYELTVNDGITIQTKSVYITVLQTREVELRLEGRPEEEIFEGDEVLVTATSGFDTYKLMLNGETVQEAGVYSYLSFQAELGTYIVRVFATDNNYCVTQHQISIHVDSKKLPDVFTPNHDGVNDIFLEFLEKPNAPEDFQLEVYTRSGVLLYKGNKGWDGTYKGKLMSQGTYLYVVRRKMNSGEYRIFTGNVTLKM